MISPYKLIIIIVKSYNYIIFIYILKTYLRINLLILSRLSEGSSSNEKSSEPSNSGSSSGSCIDSKNGCFKASSTLILVVGSKSNMLSSKSWASLGKVGNYSANGTFSLWGRDSIYFKAYSLVICLLVLSSGVPRKLIIKLIYSI